MKFSKMWKVALIVGAAFYAMPAVNAQTRAGAKNEEPKRATVKRKAPMTAVRATKTNDKAVAARSSQTRAVLAKDVRGVTVDADAVARHQINPAHIANAVSDEGFDENEAAAPVRALITKSRRTMRGSSAAAVRADIAKMTPKAKAAIARPKGLARAVPTGPITPGPGGITTPPKPRLDVNAFGEAFHAAVKDNVAGYALRIGKNGQTIYTLQWNWAQTPTDASLGWNPGRRMHIASVSKLITAIAMVDLLQAKNISYDAKIINYLPTHWQKGPNIDDITFRQLLTHRSGFSTGGSSSNYVFMKSQVAAGVSSNAIGSPDYENMNFGLCRILLAVINGNISKNAMFPALINNVMWDIITTQAYQQYVEDKVFAPAGVSGPDLDKPNNPARAYSWPVSGGGWDSGNLRSMAGGAAWHMSINELLAVMHTYRRTNKIVPMSKSQDALDAGFGVDRITTTSAGKLYGKNGLWRDCNPNSCSPRTEQSDVLFMPDGMDIAVFTNSPIGPNAASLRNLVRDLYIANIVEP
ncbi:MAG: beta-lactamase family protein [Alphaproteobacteria bacterium]|nr:beta-lactamase family protein [Alphaproteobacteria bacterium]